jgi:hypothetical protein
MTMITRRGLLQGILAAGMAPAIVKAEILMPVRQIIVPSRTIITGAAELCAEIRRQQDLRDLARQQLARWHSLRFDEIMYQELTAGKI